MNNKTAPNYMAQVTHTQRTSKTAAERSTPRHSFTALEKPIEQYLVRQINRIGGLALKFTSPSMSGVPDRILLLPSPKRNQNDKANQRGENHGEKAAQCDGDNRRESSAQPGDNRGDKAERGRVLFVETKAPGKKPRPLQVEVHKKLRDLGFRVEVIDSFSGVDRLVEELTEARQGDSHQGDSHQGDSHQGDSHRGDRQSEDARHEEKTGEQHEE